jgi:hypothetical protein
MKKETNGTIEPQGLLRQLYFIILRSDKLPQSGIQHKMLRNASSNPKIYSSAPEQQYVLSQRSVITASFEEKCIQPCKERMDELLLTNSPCPS